MKNPQSSLLFFYAAMVRKHLNFGNPAWYNAVEDIHRGRFPSAVIVLKRLLF